MIYLENYKYTQHLQIPKGFPGVDGPFILVLKSTVDNKVHEWPDLNETVHNSLYHEFDIALGENFQEGEYEYTLTNKENDIFATGIAIVVKDKSEVKQYEQENEFKQFREV